MTSLLFRVRKFSTDAGAVALYAQVSKAFKVPTLDQLFDPPGEMLDPGGRQQCFGRKLG